MRALLRNGDATSGASERARRDRYSIPSIQWLAAGQPGFEPGARKRALPGVFESGLISGQRLLFRFRKHVANHTAIRGRVAGG
jgi:hypothetical protein